MVFFKLLRLKLHSPLILLIISTRQCFGYQPIGRWGHSSTVTTAGLFVYGGMTDQYNSYSYTSAPNSNDLLFLPLNSSFDSTSPPWKLLNASSNVSGQSGPALAWHTLSTINDSCLMLFGGQPGPDSPTESYGLADSIHFLNLADFNVPYWTFEPQSWGNEPVRRIHHSSTVTDSSSVIIIGGERADGSDNVFSDIYAYDARGVSFVPLSTNTGPASVFGHRSIMLSDGRLLVLGGYNQSQGALVPFSDIWSLDVRSGTPTWSLLTPSSTNLPTPRRAFAATLLYNDNVLIHGGADDVLQQNYGDGWILDTSSDPMTWTKVDALTQLGPRRDHFAVSSGTHVVFGFGYATSGPCPPTLYIYDVTNNAFVTKYTPSPSASSRASSTPTGTQHSSGAPADPSVTRSGSPDPQSSDAGNKHTRTTALVVVFCVLGAVIVVLSLYYMRRRHKRHRHFVGLADGDADSARSRSIPAAVMIDDITRPERRSRFSIFHSLQPSKGLASTKQEALRRRDMLADEDAYDSEWYHLRHARDERTSWSFGSFMSTRLRGQERSSTTNGSIISHTQEMSDPFLDEDIPYEGAGLLGRKEQKLQYIERSQPTYQDPFADPVELEDESTQLPRMILAPVHVPPFPPQQSSPNLTGSFNSHLILKPADAADRKIERLDSTSENIIPSNTEIASMAFATSLINANRGPLQPISRRDSWWKRFTRHSFLDRKLSNTSRKSPSIDCKEYNAPLMSIEEHVDMPPLKAVASRSVEIVNNHVKTKSMSNLYDKAQHGRSFSSFQTADTEAIEKIGCMVDVVQRDRTSSYRLSSSSVDAISFEGQESMINSDGSPVENTTTSTTQAASSQMYLSDAAETPEDDPTAPPLVAGGRSGGLVTDRVRAFERRLSQDNESPRKITKDADDTKVKYGLAPRPSLFVANPDRRYSDFSS